MGRDKAFLQVGGETILARVIGAVRPVVDELFLVGGDGGRFAGCGLAVVPDLLPGHGSLGGIYTAVARARHPFVLCVACDMPFLAPSLLAALLREAGADCDAVIPRPATGPEPLLAAYGRTLLPRLEHALRRGELRIMDALSGARVRFLGEPWVARHDPQRRSFLNVNTPRDLEEARAAEGARR